MTRRPGRQRFKRSGQDTPLAPGELVPPSPPVALFVAIGEAVKTGEWGNVAGLLKGFESGPEDLPELVPPSPPLGPWLDTIETEARRILKREGFVARLPCDGRHGDAAILAHQTEGYRFPNMPPTVRNAVAAIYHVVALRARVEFPHAASVAHHALFLGLAVATLRDDLSERARAIVSERWEPSGPERTKRDNRLEQAYLALRRQVPKERGNPNATDEALFRRVAEDDVIAGHPCTTARMVRTAVKGQ